MMKWFIWACWAVASAVALWFSYSMGVATTEDMRWIAWENWRIAIYLMFGAGMVALLNWSQSATKKDPSTARWNGIKAGAAFWCGLAFIGGWDQKYAILPGDDDCRTTAIVDTHTGKRVATVYEEYRDSD